VSDVRHLKASNGVFIPFTAFLVIQDRTAGLATPLLTTLGIFLCVSTVFTWTNGRCIPPLFQYVAAYTMNIFLLHTICAAPVQAVLIKTGVHSFPVHLLCGLVFSFFVPIIIGLFAKRHSALGSSFRKQAQPPPGGAK